MIAPRRKPFAAPPSRRADRRPLPTLRRSVRLTLPGFMPVVPPRFVVAGSQTVTASGNFTVPEYNTITFTLRGAGGEGGAYNSGSNQTGGSGGATTIVALSLTANGGSGGTYGSPGAGGAGGTATGGDTNTTGATGGNGSGTPGTSATGGQGGGSGGAGGVDSAPTDAISAGVAGSAGAASGQGGGGEGNAYQATVTKTPTNYAASGGGGGQGGLCVKTYTRGAAGAPNAGDVLALVIGSGGTGRTKGGDGYRGQIDVSWS